MDRQRSIIRYSRTSREWRSEDTYATWWSFDDGVWEFQWSISRTLSSFSARKACSRTLSIARAHRKCAAKFVDTVGGSASEGCGSFAEDSGVCFVDPECDALSVPPMRVLYCLRSADNAMSAEIRRLAAATARAALAALLASSVADSLNGAEFE